MDSAVITAASSQQLEAVQGDEGRVGLIVLEIIKAMKALRLYDQGNQIVEQRLASLERQLHPFLEEHSELTIRVLPFELRWDGQTVHRNTARELSLPFRLYSERLRSLTLQAGLRRSALITLLEILNADFRNDTRAEDDIVTLLWEADLVGVEYEAAEETVAPVDGQSLDDFLAASESGGATGASGELDAAASGEVEAVQLPTSEELQRPDVLPAERARLTPEEAQRLSDDVQIDAQRDLLLEVPTVMSEIVHQHPDGAEERERLTEVLCNTADSLLESAPAQRCFEFLTHLLRLERDLFADSEAVHALSDGLFGHLSTKEGVDALARIAESLPVESMPMLEVLFRRLAPGATPHLLDAAIGCRRAGVRRLLCDLIAARGPEALPAIGRAVESSHGAVARDLIAAAARIRAPETRRLLVTACEHADAGVRAEAVSSLAASAAEEVRPVFLERLEDSDAKVRSLALAALGGRATTEELHAIQDRLASWVPGQSGDARRTLFRVIAAIGGQEAVRFLREKLLQNRLFGRSQHLADSTYAADALARLALPEAQAALEEGARRAARPVRKVCRALVARNARRRGK